MNTYYMISILARQQIVRGASRIILWHSAYKTRLTKEELYQKVLAEFKNLYSNAHTDIIDYIIDEIFISDSEL